MAKISAGAGVARDGAGMTQDRIEGVALVTGGGRGIGAAIARDLASAGARVAIMARTPSQIDAVAREIGGLSLVADVRDEDQVRACVDRAESELGPVTLVVNNAGVGNGPQPSWEVESRDWWRVFEVNVLGAFHVTRAVLPNMIARGGGRVVSIGTAAGYATPSPAVLRQGTCYGASKAALSRFTEMLAIEGAPYGVFAFVVSPGYVRSEMSKAYPDDLPWTPPDQTAGVVRVLASGRADALSGRYIHPKHDDVEELIRRGHAIAVGDLQAVRLRK